MKQLLRYNGKLVSFNGKLISYSKPLPPAFIITIDTTKGNGLNSFTLPLTNHTTNLSVILEDNSEILIPTYNSPNRTINFANYGTKILKIYGECGWSFNNTGDKLKIISIDQWGETKFNNLVSGFYGCSNLISLPINGSINAPLVTSLADLFRSCNFSLINNIDIFKLCINTTIFSRILYGCTSLISIPPELFKYNTNINDFSSSLNGCISLTTIPIGLFDNNINVTNFRTCFSGCTNLIEIPIGLFKYNINVTEYTAVLQNCTNLITIPSDLFKYNINVTNFSTCFRGCTNLIEIPIGLFDNNIDVTTFSNTFYGCTGLITIPADIFRYNINVTDFSSVFNGCTSLNSIPERLFYYNNLVINYDRIFNDAFNLNLILPSEIFDLNNLTIVTNFYRAFYHTTIENSPTGIMQPIWEVFYDNDPYKIECFWNCFNLTNYLDIPMEWTGE